MTGRRRISAGPRTANVTVIATEKPQAPTQVIVPAPSLAEEIRQNLTSPGFGTFAETLVAEAAAYDAASVPVPSRDSNRAVDRQAWFDAHGGPEQLFEALVAALNAMWLLDTSLPVPVREKAPEAAEDTGPGSGAPPAGDDRDVTAPVSPEPVTSEAAEDETAAKECAE